ncbi:MAG: hypothetical protein KF744_11630 [Taibaiella sp.]|nr:hypothetical protein [Taibaiella sp.]
MKSILLAVMALLSLSAQAKKKKPEPAFAKGDFTLMAGTAYPDVLGFQGWKPTAIFTVIGEYQASPRFAFGIQYLLSYATEPWRTINTSVNSSPYTFQYRKKATNHLVMATAEYAFVNRGRTSLSSGIAIGYTPAPSVSTQYSDNINHTNSIVSSRDYGHIAFRLRILTAKVKLTDNFGVYGGLGYGIDGLFALGAHYTFKHKK